MDRDLIPAEFQRFHDLIYKLAGIHYPAEKMALLSNRIRRRLRATKVATYDAYLQLVQTNSQPAEVQAFLDSITTNETYFFRCQRHWDFFREWATARAADPATRREGFRIWSAAASTGAEAFTICIVLHQILGNNFGGVPVEILGTDLSASILEEARAGVYRPYAVAQTPPDVVKKYFTKQGTEELLFDRQLARHVTFQRHNLMEPLMGARNFDFVFLRNVMIYFDVPSKEKVMRNAHAVTRPGGYLMVGESESLMNLDQPFTYVKPSIFQRKSETTAPART
ncbi:MAG: protein-glutamate O-methyltransferase CheR [Planctomycetes bacterium]|nr:protein-glutamate O-methyltransferase CheR [Planctomycetota bacterium]MCB9884768.1 protein-glutamate O-methyltransferase CheR [Planctomycetota bacterium]